MRLTLNISTILLFLFSLLSVGTNYAQTRIEDSGQTLFVHLPSKEYPAGTWYTTQYEGRTNVQFLYPEFVSLTKTEKRELSDSLLEIFSAKSDSIIIEKHTLYDRKRPVTEINVYPFAKHKGQIVRLTAFTLKSLPIKPQYVKKEFAKESSKKYAEQSKLQSGKWVKIQVAEEGIYQLTDGKLKEWGFSGIDKVKVYGYGGRMLPETFPANGEDYRPDDLPEVPLFKTNDGRALFFAEGTVTWTWEPSKSKWTHQRNPYSLSSYYFITEGDKPLDFPTFDNSSLASLVTSSTDTIKAHALLDEDHESWYEGGREFFDGHDFQTSPTHNFTLAAPFAINGQESIVDIGFGASSALSETNVEVKLNDEMLGGFSISKYGEYEIARMRQNSYISESVINGNNTLRFTATGGNSARLDYIRITYDKRLNGKDTGKSFSMPYLKSPFKLRIGGAAPQTKLWRIGENGTTTSELKGTLTGDSLSVFIEDPSQRYVIVNIGNNYPEPQFAGQIQNQNLHSLSDGPFDMVIITPGNGKYDEQAQRLADFHTTHDGLRTKIVRTNQIYNEFSSGTPDVTAYRRYLKMLYDRATSDELAPRYLLLMGPSLWDNRGVTKKGKFSQDDYILCYENNGTATSSTVQIGSLQSYVTDDYLALLDDGEGVSIMREKIDIGVGRFVCSSPEEAAVLVDKSIAYARGEQTGAWKNTMVFIADEGDNNLHMKDTEAVVKASETVSENRMITKKIYPDAYTRTTTATGNSFPEVTSIIKKQMQKGAALFNYAGHGSEARLSHSFLLTIDDVEQNVSPTLPVWVFASCEITPYDQEVDDLGRQLLMNEKGGAVAVICSSRAVYASYNNAIHIALCSNLLKRDTDGRRITMGDAMRLSKTAMINGRNDMTVNKMKYSLLGDPALRLMIPTAHAVIDSIDGVALSSNGDLMTLKAGSKARFSGHIEAHPDFEGLVSATVFDREETITCKNNDRTAKTPMQFKQRNRIAYEGTSRVSNGRFNIEMMVPRSISYSNDAARIVLYAVSADSSLEAHGEDLRFCLNGTDNQVETDSAGPQVTIWLDNPDFTDGGAVGTEALFGAAITDSTGIDATGSTIGHDMELIIDNDPSRAFVVNDYFTYDFNSYVSGTVNYPLTGLTPGNHELKFKVWDLFGNPSTTRLNFIVAEGREGKFSATLSKNPARTSTNIVVTNINLSDNSPLLLEIFDAYGRCVFTHTTVPKTNFSSFLWNLNGNTGGRVKPSIYMLHAKYGSQEIKNKKIIVLKQ